MSSNPSDYEKPEWSSLPLSTDYGLEVLKQGTIVEDISLRDREYFLLGRQLDRVHIPAEHPSISRIHAVFNFRNDGALMLRDLGSAQGTLINKVACSRDTYYRLKVGDMIKFGASTRFYIVKGPNEDTPMEYDSENLRKLRREAEEREEATLKKKEEREFLGTSWGMSFEDFSEGDQAGADEDDSDSRKGYKRSSLPEYLRKDENYDRKYGDKFEADIKADEIHNKKDEEILEKIRKKERKIQNMQEEIRRIYLKEQSQDEGLTEGQLAAVARNDKAIEQLSQDIESLVKQIRDKNLHREAINSKTEGGNKRAREDNDDDDILDTTAQTADASTNWRLKKKMNKLSTTTQDASSSHASHNSGHGNNNALSYQEIKTSFDEISAKLSKSQEELTAATAKVQGLQLQLVHSSIGGTEKLDEIDRVIIQDEIKEAQQRMKSLNLERDQLQIKIRNLQKLMTAAAPSLKSTTSTTLAITANAAAVLPTVAKELKPKIEQTSSQPIEVKPRQEVVAATVASTKPQHVVPTFVKDDPQDYQTHRLMALQDFKKFVEEEKKRATSEIQVELKPQVEVKKIDAQALSAFERSLQAAAYGDLDTDSNNPTQSSFSASNKKVKGPEKPAFLASPEDEYDNHTTMSHLPSLPIPTNHSTAAALEGGDYVWVPPKQQKGDGRTSLNDKFGY